MSGVGGTFLGAGLPRACCDVAMLVLWGKKCGQGRREAKGAASPERVGEFSHHGCYGTV